MLLNYETRLERDIECFYNDFNKFNYSGALTLDFYLSHSN